MVPLETTLKVRATNDIFEKFEEIIQDETTVNK